MPTFRTGQLIAGLRHREAYPIPGGDAVEVHETHISIVFLVGDFAYKVKKSVRTDFLDYSTLELRKLACDEELRLDSRYANDLYLDVVSIALLGGVLVMEGDGQVVEYAVKMQRFPKGALLSERIDAGNLSSDEVLRLARGIADFHLKASVCEANFASTWPEYVYDNSEQIFKQLANWGGLGKNTSDTATLDVLQQWSRDYFAQYRQSFKRRVDDGRVRECHGDLHLQNVVYWNGHLIPFDGIEFNQRLRWIDVLSDAAFLAMDLAARGHLDLCRGFTNAYLEHTDDYESLAVLPWFLFYRAIVRALVASMQDQTVDFRKYLELAYRFTLKEPPRLWITHGVSGSGKTTHSNLVVERYDAIRLRSDIQRKRLHGLSATQRPTAEQMREIYSEDSNRETYNRLSELARSVLDAGYSVVVDATFLRQRDRDQFARLADAAGVPFAILDCFTDEQTLRQRVADRLAGDADASDAGVNVLEHQLQTRQPLLERERQYVERLPEIVEAVEQR